jgi:hypothetical protein
MPKVRREIVKETSQGKHKIELNQWPWNVGRLHWKSSLFLSLKPTLKWSQADPSFIGTLLAGRTNNYGATGRALKVDLLHHPEQLSNNATICNAGSIMLLGDTCHTTRPSPYES